MSFCLIVWLGCPCLGWADATLLIHGHIYTGNPSVAWSAALAIQGSRIQAVGTDAAILKLRNRHRRVIDLQGRTVIPGIVDSHIHMLYGAYCLHGLNLSTPEYNITPAQPEVLVARLKAHAALYPYDAVLFGRADFSTTPPTTPRHELLDRAVADRPVVILNLSGHGMWLNAAALQMAGITDRPVADPVEERGVLRDASGRPSGTLLEAATSLADRAIALHLPREELLAMLEAAGRYMNSFGVTSVVNATGSLAEIELYATLRDRGQLTFRTRTSFGAVAVEHHLTPQLLADLEKARELYHVEWVAANLVKLFADGGSGPYPPLVYTRESFEAVTTALDARGYQLMTHAVRPDSVEMVLNAYAHLEQVNGPRDRRLRIEHGFLINPTDLPRLAGLSVVLSTQPVYCCTELGNNFGPEDAIPTDRWHSALQSGATIAFGSDWMGEWPPSPFLGIQEAVTRQVWLPPAGSTVVGAHQAGAVPTGTVYNSAEQISVTDAVRAYTQGAAFAAFWDQDRGSLEVGKLADLAVLSQDIFAAAPEQIGSTSVLLTIVGGKVVYRSEHWGKELTGRRVH